MPKDMKYFYDIRLVSKTGAARTERCEYAVSAYDFSAVNGSALCYIAPGTVLSSAHTVLSGEGYPGPRPTGEITVSTKTVGADGMWMTIAAGALKPV